MPYSCPVDEHEVGIGISAVFQKMRVDSTTVHQRHSAVSTSSRVASNSLASFGENASGGRPGSCNSWVVRYGDPDGSQSRLTALMAKSNQYDQNIELEQTTDRDTVFWAAHRTRRRHQVSDKSAHELSASSDSCRSAFFGVARNTRKLTPGIDEARREIVLGA